MAHDFEAAIYVKGVPEFRSEEGLVSVCHTTGRMRFELIMRRNTFIKALRAAEKLASELDEDGATVTQIRRRKTPKAAH